MSSDASRRLAGEADVRPDVGEQHCRVALGATRIDDGGQRLVLDVDELRGVLALVTPVGEDGRDRLADETYDAFREQRLAHLRRVDGQGRALVDGIGEIGRGHDGHAARHVERCAGIDRHDPRVRDGGAHDGQPQRSGETLVVQVLGVDGAGGQELGILEAFAPAYRECCRGEDRVRGTQSPFAH